MSSISEILAKSKNPDKKINPEKTVNSQQNRPPVKKIKKIKRVSSISDILDKNSVDKSKLKSYKKSIVSSAPKVNILTPASQTTIIQKTDALIAKNPVQPIDPKGDFSVSSLSNVLPIPLDLVVKPEEMTLIKKMLEKRINVTAIEDNVNMIKIGISVVKRVLSLYNISGDDNKKSDSPYDNLILC